MGLVHFDPATKKVHYNSSTKKVHVSKAVCEHCSGSPPQSVKVTFSGILYCTGIGNCHPGSVNSKKKVLSMGVGWNGDVILTPGRALPKGPESNDWYREFPPLDCNWCDITYDDFGYFDEYALDECGGGVLGRCYYNVRYVRTIISAGQVYIAMELGYYGYDEGHDTIFIQWHSCTIPANCFPYGVEIDNDYECDGNTWRGDGTAKFTAT